MQALPEEIPQGSEEVRAIPRADIQMGIYKKARKRINIRLILKILRKKNALKFLDASLVYFCSPKKNVQDQILFTLHTGHTR